MRSWNGTDCIETTHWHRPDGYGTIQGVKRHGKPVYRSNRLAWIDANGPIPDGLHVLHHCDWPPCINPLHLFLGTAKANVDDMHQKKRSWQAQRTHCPRNHPYAGDNLYVNPAGQRQCRQCARDRGLAWFRANKAKKRK